MKGTYVYSHYNRYTGDLSSHKVRVKILKIKSASTVRIRLLGWHADGRQIGSEMTVRRENVIPDEAPQQEQPREPIREIRKPYKDD